MTLSLLRSLTTRASRLVFCDDADLDAARGMQPNLRILASFETTAERYGPVAQAMTSRLASIGVSEFHAADMANPSRRSDWRRVSRGERLDAFAFVAEQFNGLEASAGYIYCAEGQYAALRAQAQRRGPVGVGFRHGLKRVFLRSVLERLELPQATLLVIDQDRSQAGARLDPFVPVPDLVGGGVISASSHLCAGLQLADALVWSITRFIRHRHRFDTAEQDDFDDIALSIVGGNAGRLRNLHDPAERAA